MTDAILKDLARAKAAFQQRTIEALLTEQPKSNEQKQEEKWPTATLND